MAEIVRALFGSRAAGGTWGGRCAACGSPDTRRRAVTNQRSGSTTAIRTCSRCGHVAILDGSDDLGVGARCGTSDTTERELAMARLAVEVLRRNRLDVLVYGAERFGSPEFTDLPRVRRVVTGAATHETFDIVIAADVIQHFHRPRQGFASLFESVHRAGLLVCSADIYDAAELTATADIIGRGQMQYYTPEALRTIGKASGLQVDFRLPCTADDAERRRRYVLFSYSSVVMEAISDYFGRTAYPPAEQPVRQTPEARDLQQVARAAARAGKSPIGRG